MYMHVFVHIRQNFGSKLAKYKILYLFAASWRRMKTSGRVAWRKVYMAISGTGHNSSQDLGANSSTSTHGPWSGHQIIPYRLSDVWKIKHAVAVMTADTIRINSHLHILRDNRFQEIIFMFIINTHEYIKIHTLYVHNTFINSGFVFCLYWLVCSYSFVNCLYIKAKYISIHCKYIPIHINTCDTCNTTLKWTCGRWGLSIQANTSKYIQKTSKKHTNTCQYAALNDHGFTFGHEGIVLVLCWYLSVLTCIWLIFEKTIHVNTINTIMYVLSTFFNLIFVSVRIYLYWNVFACIGM